MNQFLTQSFIKIMNKCFPIKEILISSENSCNHDWELHRELGTDGTYGEIWSVCCKNDCNFVMKYMPYDDGNRRNTRENIINEINVQNLCAEAKLCPKIHDAWLCESGGVFIMEVYKMTARQLLFEYENKDQILDNVLVLVSKLHDRGIYHGDLHLDNIMVKPRKETVNSGKYVDDEWEYRFIDFGKGKRFTSMDDYHIEEDFSAIKDHVRDLMDENPNRGFESLYQKMKIQMKRFSDNQESDEEFDGQ